MGRFFSLLLVLAAIASGVLVFLSEKPRVAWASTPSVIGVNTPLTLKIDSPHAAKKIAVTVEQNGQTFPVFDKLGDSDRFKFWQKKFAPINENIVVRSGNMSLVDGAAELIAEVSAGDFRAATTELRTKVFVSTRPASVVTDNAEHTMSWAGVGAVRYTVDGDWTEAGVKVGKYSFRAFATPGTQLLPGRRSDVVSFFTYPWDVNDQPVLIFVKTSSGDLVTDKVRVVRDQRRPRERNINIDDGFLQKAMAELDPGGAGALVQRFIKVNNKVRQSSFEKLRDLAKDTSPQLLWDGAFLQMPKSEMQAEFADQRTYVAGGRAVDRQVHLGIDLASFKHAVVPAANSGKVVFADRLGIFGNCVVIDHGMAVMTVYGHLSQLDVKVGNNIRKGDQIGLTGMTGMAGGDHLHYSLLVDGIDANPIKLFERNWIRKHIAPVIPVSGL
jgi:murein DD-endopeptidase MepM/ murein hydrolase activator NlpD